MASRIDGAQPRVREVDIQPLPDVMPTAVMGTNDNCTVSKRSVEMLYYPKPHFYRYFVKKPKKRTALINRGYLLRMRAIEHELKQFLTETTGQKVVINLGCGYDALPFKVISEARQLVANTTFVDVDYKTLMQEKIQIIKQNQELLGLLQGIDGTKESELVLLRSNNYMAVGCDLADCRLFQDLLAREFAPDVSFFIISEVSITYMPVDMADAILIWMSRLKLAKFCLLEQCLPNGPTHPFASTMLKHFNKLSSPLRVVQRYQSIENQKNRFRDYGWKDIKAQSLWNIWCQSEVFSPRERIDLRSKEVFDEHEEFALFASHYFVLTATSLGTFMDGLLPDPEDDPQVTLTSSALLKSLTSLRPRKDGVIYEVQQEIYAYHGGDDGKSRSTTTQIYVSDAGSQDDSRLANIDVPTRKYHTITKLNANNDHLLVGGRESPEKSLRDCWLGRDSTWTRVEELPEPLFRHSATLVPIRNGLSSEEIPGVLVFGGKTSHDKDSNAWYLWTEGHGWKVLDGGSAAIAPRFSSNFSYIQSLKVGVLLGGMISDETVSGDAFTWRLSDDEIVVRSISLTNDDKTNTELYRSGATLVQYDESLVLIGGITRNGLPVGDVMRFELDSNNTQYCKDLIVNQISQDLPQPLLIGHSTIFSNNMITIVGGGAICFSFGSYMNTTTWHLDLDSSPDGSWRTALWKPYTVQQTTEHAEATDAALHTNTSKSTRDDSRPDATAGFISVNRIGLDTKDTLPKRMAKGKPCVFESVNLGGCVEKWSPEYLKAKVDSTQLFDVHNATTDTMLFESKNFQIQKQVFPEFIDAVVTGQRRYLRAVSLKDKHKPADFQEDFGMLAPDFRLPSHISIDQDLIHSSILRISGPINMWLHYDTLSNILCQIRGSKRMILFSPADVAHLKIPPGRSGSDLNVFDLKAWETTTLRHTHPYEAILRPGDVLYIPPLWCHAALPLDEMSVAINTFFKTEDDQRYANGKDTYGNKDISEYEYARKDVAKMIDRFSSMPKDTQRFYLERLADEVLQKARNKK